MTPTETLADLAQSRGVDVREVHGTAMLDVFRDGGFLFRCNNVKEATEQVRQLYTPEERARFARINNNRKVNK